VLDTASPSLARAWDYLLGGGASFAADRSLAQRLEALHPGIRETLFSSRTYAAGAVTRIARAGVDQYLDLGAGLPTRPCTHETARALLPGARVAYVDRDQTVTEHGRALVPAGVRYVPGDLAEPEAILASGDLAGFIDFARPVCVVLTLVLHVLEPGTARAVAGVLVRALAPGSYLVVTAGPAALPESVWPGGLTADDVASFFAGLDLVPPGIEAGSAVGATGVKPGAAR
jgi:O-methyltransferase involved in polyketide biosynthesis